jgi:hypothetical protein
LVLLAQHFQKRLGTLKDRKVLEAQQALQLLEVLYLPILQMVLNFLVVLEDLVDLVILADLAILMSQQGPLVRLSLMYPWVLKDQVYLMILVVLQVQQVL